MNEEKFYLWIIGILGAAALAIYLVYSYKDLKMAEMGFQQTMVTGSSTSLYQKVQ